MSYPHISISERGQLEALDRLQWSHEKSVGRWGGIIPRLPVN